MSEAPRTVHLYLLEGFADWEASYAVARLNDPAWQRRPGELQVRTVAHGRQAVRSMGGLRVEPDLAVFSIAPSESALLILPGGDGWAAGAGAPGLQKAAEFLREGVPVAAICGATFGLARAGLLDARDHTSNSLEFLKGAPRYRGEARYRERPVVTDGGLISAGATAAVDFAAEIFRELDAFEPAVIDRWRALFGGRAATAV